MQDNYHPLALTRFKRNAIALAVATALPAGTAYAQDIKELPTAQASAQSEDSYKVDKSTSLKYTQPLLDTAKTITVIPQSIMKDRNVDSLRDALRNVPGISLAAGEGGTPAGDSMTIRGFNARTDIMIDGVRDIAGYSRDTYNVEAIEVAKGPVSAVYGRGSTGGSINLQSKTARLENFSDVNLRSGTEKDHRAQLDTNIAMGGSTALRINLLTDDGEVAGRDEVENSKNAIALSFASGLGTDSRFSVNADYQKQDNLPDYGAPWVPNYSGRDTRTLHPDIAAFEGTAPSVNYSNFYGNVHRDFEDINAQSLTLKYEKDVNTTTTLRVLARSGSVERQSIVSAPRFRYTGAGTVTDPRVYGEGARIGLNGEKTRDEKNSLDVLQLDLSGHYTTATTRHDVVTGVEMFREKVERWRFDDNRSDNLDTGPETVDLYNPNPFVAYNGSYGRTDKYRETNADTVAIYVFDTVTLSEQWQVSAGLRYDQFDTAYSYQLDDDIDPGAAYEIDDGVFSWSAGTVYKPTSNGSLYAALGSSTNPSAEGLTIRRSQQNVDPEETLSYELGTKWELFDGQLLTHAALFRTEKTNARTTDPTTGEVTIDGRQRVDGLELSATGQISDQLSIAAAYTFQDSEVLKSDRDGEKGNNLARTPEHSFSVWSRYELGEKLVFGLGAQYMDERYNSSNSGRRSQADDYLIYDLMLSYQINGQWDVQLNGVNLTDEQYEDQLGGGHFVPGEGRYLSMSTSWSF